MAFSDELFDQLLQSVSARGKSSAHMASPPSS
jgi:hypothetical protein